MAVFCALGVFMQIARRGRVVVPEHEKDRAAQRSEFADVLQHSQASSEAVKRLSAAFDASLDAYDRLLSVSSRFMAGAATVVAGLFSVIAFLWCRLREVQARMESIEGARERCMEATAASGGEG